jgi:hypothetical protein
MNSSYPDHRDKISVRRSASARWSAFWSENDDGDSHRQDHGGRSSRSIDYKRAKVGWHEYQFVQHPRIITSRLPGDIFKLTDSFCAEHLDSEYGQLCRKLIAKLARKRPSPLARGDLRIWAAAAIYAVGSINFLFDSSQDIFMTGDQISLLTGIPKSTLSNKAKQIRDSLKLYQIHPEFSRRELLANSPVPWLVKFNGLIVDARTLPADVQAEARRKRLIPDLGPE